MPRDLQTGSSSRLQSLSEAFPGLSSSEDSWYLLDQSTAVSWSASHQPWEFVVQRGRAAGGCCCYRAHTRSGPSVSRWKRQFLELARPVWLASGAQWQSYHVPPERDRLCPAGTSLLHIFSPSNPTKPHSQHEKKGIAARLAGRDRLVGISLSPGS